MLKGYAPIEYSMLNQSVVRDTSPLSRSPLWKNESSRVGTKYRSTTLRMKEERGKGKGTKTKGRPNRTLSVYQNRKNLKAWRGFSSALNESGVRSSTRLVRLDLRVDAP